MNLYSAIRLCNIAILKDLKYLKNTHKKSFGHIVFYIDSLLFNLLPLLILLISPSPSYFLKTLFPFKSCPKNVNSVNGYTRLIIPSF